MTRHGYNSRMNRMLAGLRRALFPILRIVCGFMAGVSLYAVWRGAPWILAQCRRWATLLLVGFLVWRGVKTSATAATWLGFFEIAVFTIETAES